MLINLLLGLSTMIVCLLLQGVLVIMALRYYARHLEQARTTIFGAMRVTSGLMLILIVGNIAQVAAWALLFCALGEFSDFDVALYHSGVNFATLGYGDIVMSEQHRLLGPLQSINGVLMIGVSTAALSRAFQAVVRVALPGNTGGEA
ncbi:two pore domain potassium channel family protein [Mangrovimicrobium sediminis]|uniref:Two pore domain potassium channel family protein n=1 Tax=Mangrovimicrobium sediminis TaxID=2562682 RepID=A0A4Z0LZS1_9GAMM|nr:ion channel [Haliea sp. SAOS-164]TGD72686.1 two pore domain potassium channel family protein [Haliea sp. SAOS-164]